MKNLLVTGGRGFIGSHLLNRLSKEEYNIINFSRSQIKESGNSKIKYIQGDITDYDCVDKAIENLEGIINLSALSRVSEAIKNPQECVDINVKGAMNILECAKNKKKLPWIILGGTNESKENIYGFSKYMSELGAEIYSKNYGMKILSLRFATTYGPRDKPDKLIPKLITRSIENQDLTINNSKKEFDFIYIDDIINGIYLGIKHIESIQERYYDSIPLCTGKTTNLEKLAKVIIKETKSASNIIIKEEKEEVFSLIDSKKAKKILGFEAKVSIEEGIKKTIENFNSY